MKKIGLLIGRERSFPEALISEINGRNGGVTAEMITVTAPRIDDVQVYDLIIDRISHDVPFFQPMLKLAVLNGTRVINNPFWRIADDKFFGTALAQRLGIAVPRTFTLPSKSYTSDVSSESLRNLAYPLDWDAVLKNTGLPAVLKPHWGGGWRDVSVVHSKEELLEAYDRSDRKVMILQEFIDWTQYVRCICIGQKHILPAVWDPTRPHHERYASDLPPLSPALKTEVEKQARTLNRALGYDMNTVEFGIRDGIPYAIDFMNSAPDFDISSLREPTFTWVVNTMADFVIGKLKKPVTPPTYRWDSLLRR